MNKQQIEKRLRNCHPKDYPDANCQYLAKRLLKEGAKMADIAEELEINYQTLNAHWIRSCRPLLAGLGIYLGNDHEALKQYILDDPKQKLTKCDLKNNKKQFVCNAQDLAKLLIIENPPSDFVAIAEKFTKSGIIIKPEVLEQFWHYKCLILLGKIAIQLGYEQY